MLFRSADAQALYAILEQQVVPTFYDRGPDGIPRRWLQVVRQSIRTVLPRFSARRMVKEYVSRMYVPAAAAAHHPASPASSSNWLGSIVPVSSSAAASGRPAWFSRRSWAG